MRGDGSLLSDIDRDDLARAQVSETSSVPSQFLAWAYFRPPLHRPAALWPARLPGVCAVATCVRYASKLSPTCTGAGLSSCCAPPCCSARLCLGPSRSGATSAEGCMVRMADQIQKLMAQVPGSQGLKAVA